MCTPADEYTGRAGNMLHEDDPLLQEEDAAKPELSVCTRDFTFGLLLSAACTIAAGALIYQDRGEEGLTNFLASYLMEMSLSMDNMFAFYLIFKFYRCPAACQATCLFWGIAGAVILRATILLLGTAMVLAAKPLMLIFAALLVYSSFGMIASSDDDDDDLESNRVVRCVRWLKVPVTADYRGTLFFAREGGSLRATPLLLVLATIELSDIVFAVDSVPAVLGLSTDPLCAYVAVMCAVLSLRTLYTLAVVVIKAFRYLQHAVALLLAFVGAKIVLEIVFGVSVPTRVSLIVIVVTLLVGVLASCAARGCK